MNLFNQAYTTNFHNFNVPKIQDKIHPTIPQVTYITKYYNMITRISNQTLQCPKFQQKLIGQKRIDPLW